MYASSTHGADNLRLHTNTSDIYGVLLCEKFWKISQVDTAIDYIRRFGRDGQVGPQDMLPQYIVPILVCVNILLCALIIQISPNGSIFTMSTLLFVT